MTGTAARSASHSYRGRIHRSPQPPISTDEATRCAAPRSHPGSSIHLLGQRRRASSSDGGSLHKAKLDPPSPPVAIVVVRHPPPSVPPSLLSHYHRHLKAP
ncbi:hypothetical protein DAI22_08g151050 [Oryza sativa Japonica Group]|nr:hypothetical protein DAI22_08g151050 [Oryza sativa Japonica Group]